MTINFDREFYRSDEWRVARAERLRIDGNCCTACGGTNKLQVHHRVSITAGGSKTAMYNLQTKCKNCHDKEHPHMYNSKNNKGIKRNL